jgi:penicillin amidase
MNLAIALAACALGPVEPLSESAPSGRGLADRAVVHRDPWGVAHIDAESDEAAVFAFAYVQAEDYFWQVEDSYLAALGRYAEEYGVKGLGSDLLNRAFRIVPKAKEDYPKLDEKTRGVCDAFAAGLNHFLAARPDVQPRRIERFEGWHVLCLARHVFIDFSLMTKFLPRQYMGVGDPSVPRYVQGSNAWALGPSRTRNGSTILFCNPHQPAFGYGQMYEAHLRSGEGWDFTGATFFGSPLPGMGRNEHLGWSHTVNRPDTIDFWTVHFDRPDDPDLYRFDGGYRRADAWTETLLVKRGGKLVEETHRLRRTVHGPVVAKLGETEYLAMNIAKIDEAFPTRQHMKMVRARNLDEFKEAMSALDLFFFNTVYADREGNIYFVYNAAVPRRDPAFDWSGKLDGADPRTLWKGFHAFHELPQVVNPRSGWIQSCNSSPFTATDDGAPLRIDYPEYLAEDAGVDNLRSKVSRAILRELTGASAEDVQRLAFDTRMYWPWTELPKYRDQFRNLPQRDSALADRVRPYLEHLLDWDCVNREDCTQSTLCEEWYRQLYGTVFPPDGRMLEKYAANPDLRFEALVDAARILEGRFGSWKVPWGDVHRIQRHPNVADFLAIPFDDRKPSLPCVAAPGALGQVFTQYYTPSLNIPLVRQATKHYGIIGTTYLAVFEFSPSGVQGVSLTNFGASSDPSSPHYFDQAELMAQKRFRPALFDWKEIRAQARRTYRPGE